MSAQSGKEIAARHMGADGGELREVRPFVLQGEQNLLDEPISRDRPGGYGKLFRNGLDAGYWADNGRPR
jgi:hypothetical protein